MPELVDRQGPPFYAPEESEPGVTDIGIWDTLDELLSVSVTDRHFDCMAGQAIYNPLTHPEARNPSS
jgi:hypothetical protein